MTASLIYRFIAFQDSLDQEAEEESESAGPTWGRLVSHGGALPNIDLKPKGDDTQVSMHSSHAPRADCVFFLIVRFSRQEEFNEYSIGRNEDVVDVCVNFDARISGKHCRVFCQRSGPSYSSATAGRPAFTVFIENLSRNNTFIRTASAPSQFVTLDCASPKRRLNSGEIITVRP